MSITKYLNLSHLRKLLSALGQRFYAIEQRQDNIEQRQDNIEQRQDNLQSQIENIDLVVLTKTNTTAYTPTATYHPATKGYVDGLIPANVSDLNNDAGYQTQSQVNALIAAAGDDDTTYAISISGNIITLTGSDGNTSTVTLPVYTGGVT